MQGNIEPEHRALGYALMCCSRPTSDVEVLVNQENAMNASYCI